MGRLVLTWISVGALVATCGCGGGEADFETVGVSGVVLIDGKPAEGVDVTYVTDEFASYGTTDMEGRYELIQGAVPGENIVRLSKWEGGEKQEFDPEAGIDDGQLEDELLAMEGELRGPAVAAGPRELIPEEFREIKYTVPAGGTQSADFRIRSK